MREVLTLQEVADYLKVHRNTVYRLARKGRIPAFKVGADWRFRRDALDAWLEAGRTERRASLPEDVFHVVFWLLTEGVALTVSSVDVANLLDFSPRAAEREMRALANRELLCETGGAFALTPHGLEAARRRFAPSRPASAGHVSVVAFASRQVSRPR